jgi:hypothetical protein
VGDTDIDIGLDLTLARGNVVRQEALAHLLTQIVLAARKEDWHEQLANIGIRLSSNATFFDLTAEIQNVIDDHIANYGRRSDVSEMAQQAAGEQDYLQFGPQTQWPFQNIDRVLMFSAGLDSLAGAVQTAARGNKLVLVSHRPNSVLSNRQVSLFQVRTLFQSLRSIMLRN